MISRGPLQAEVVRLEEFLLIRQVLGLAPRNSSENTETSL